MGAKTLTWKWESQYLIPMMNIRIKIQLNFHTHCKTSKIQIIGFACAYCKTNSNTISHFMNLKVKEDTLNTILRQDNTTLRLQSYIIKPLVLKQEHHLGFVRKHQDKNKKTYLSKSSATVKIHMQILDFPIVTKCIQNMIFLCLFMYSSDQYNPSFNSCTHNNPKVTQK